MLNALQQAIIASTSTNFESESLALFSEIIERSGTVSFTHQQAVDTYIKSRKSNGTWDKADAIYFYIGGNADCHALNAKNPTGGTSSYEITWSGDLGTISAHKYWGFKANDTDFGDTHYNPSTDLATFSSNHLIDVSHSNEQNATSPMGMNELRLFTGNAALGAWYDSLATTAYRASIGSRTVEFGIVIGNRESFTDSKIYKNGVEVGSNTTDASSGTLSNQNVYVGAYNNGGANSQSMNLHCYHEIGNGLTTTDITSVNDSLTTLMSSLGRHVDLNLYDFLDSNSISDNLEIQAVSEAYTMFTASELSKLHVFNYISLHNQTAALDNLISTGTFSATLGGTNNHTSVGIYFNGTNAYLDTNFNPSTNASSNDLTIGYYMGERVPHTSTGAIFGARDSSDTNWIQGAFIDTAGTRNMVFYNPTTIDAATGPNRTSGNDDFDQGMFVYHKEGNDINIIRNGVGYATHSGTYSNRPNQDIYLGANNNSGTAENFLDNTLCGYFIGEDLTYSEAVHIGQIMESIQSKLGRSPVDINYNDGRVVALRDFTPDPDIQAIEHRSKAVLYDQLTDSNSTGLEVINAFASIKGVVTNALNNLVVIPSFDATDSGSPTYGELGVSLNGSTQYVLSGFDPNSVNNGDIDDMSFHIWLSSDSTASNNHYFGSKSSTSSESSFQDIGTGSIRYKVNESENNTNDVILPSEQRTNKLISIIRNSSTVVGLYIDGVETATFSTTQGNLSTRDIAIGAFNNNGTIESHREMRVALFMAGTAPTNGDLTIISDQSRQYMNSLRGFHNTFNYLQTDSALLRNDSSFILRNDGSLILRNV